MTAIDLYNHRLSTCSQKVRLCLAEKGLNYRNHEVSLETNEHLAPWYLELNPNGVVPTLVVDGMPVVDSSAICEFIDEQWPDKPLAPATPLERARMRSWMRYIEEVPTTAIRVPSLNRIYKGVFVGREAEFKDIARRRPLREGLYSQMGVQGFSQEMVDQSLARLSQALGRAAEALSSPANWLVGTQYSLADVLLLPTVVRLDDLGLSHLWDKYPAVANWYDRSRQRPAFAQAFRPGSRLGDRAVDGFKTSGHDGESLGAPEPISN